MINCSQNKDIQKIIRDKGFFVKKTGITMGSSKPDNSCVIIDNKLLTYIKKNNQIEEETRQEIKQGMVFLRNPQIIGKLNNKNIYNEWLLSREDWILNYGNKITDHFLSYEKIREIKVIYIDDEVLKILQSSDNISANIYVPWDKNGMKVYKGGVLTEEGFGIANAEFKETYIIKR